MPVQSALTFAFLLPPPPKLSFAGIRNRSPESVPNMARRAMSFVNRWSSRVFSVELDGVPSYFALQEKHRGEEAPGVFGKMYKSDRCYSLHVCSSDRIHSAKFYAQLRDRLVRELPGCQFLPMLSFLPHVKDSLIKGYFLTSESTDPTERILGDLTQTEPVVVCSYVRGESDGSWTQYVWSDAGDRVKMSQKYYVVPSEEPDYHPATLNIINSDVFYSFEEAREVLQKVLSVFCVHICADMQSKY